MQAAPGRQFAALSREYARLSGPGRWSLGAGAILGGVAGVLVGPAFGVVGADAGGVPDGGVHSTVGDAVGDAAFGVAPVAGAFGGFAWWLGVLAAACWGFWSLWIILADVRDHRIPNAVLTGAALSVGGLSGAALLAQGEPLRLTVALASAGCGLAVGIATWAALPGMFGAGDAKLLPLAVFVAALPGVAGVWTAFLGVVLLGLLLGGVTAIVRRRREFMLGPVLVAAGWLGAAVGAVLG